MLPKYHTVNIPGLGHPGLEFTFAIYAYALHGLWWVTEAILNLLGGIAKLIRER
jgi:hypothetical protein